MSFVQSSMKRLDIFGSKVTLNYQGQILYRTSFGGVIAILLVSFLVVLFFRNVWTLIKRSTVTYTTQLSFDEDPSVMEIGDINSMLAVKYDQTHFIKAPWMNITFEYREYNQTSSGVIQKNRYSVPLEPCTLQHFIGFSNNQFNWTEAYNNNGLNDFLCLPKGKKYKIGGAFTSQTFYHLKFILNQCVNSTNPKLPWNPTCDTPDNIAAGVNQSNRLLLYFTNNLVNPTKTTDPVKTYLDTQFFNVQPKIMYTAANVYVNEQIVKTDHSVLPTTDIEEKSYQAFAPNDYKPSNAVGNFSNYLELYIHRSPFTTTTNRKYTKIDEVISYMGGFCQVFILVASIIVNFYNDYVYTIELANRLYDFEIDSIESNSKETPDKSIKSKDSLPKQLQSQQPNNPSETSNLNGSLMKSMAPGLKKLESLNFKKSFSLDIKKSPNVDIKNPGIIQQSMKIIPDKDYSEKLKSLSEIPVSIISRKGGFTENTLPDGTPRADSYRPLNPPNVNHFQVNKTNNHLEALQEEVESQLPSHNSVLKESKNKHIKEVISNEEMRGESDDTRGLSEDMRGYINNNDNNIFSNKIDLTEETRKKVLQQSFQNQDSLNCKNMISSEDNQLTRSFPIQSNEGFSYFNKQQQLKLQSLQLSKDPIQLGFSRKVSKNELPSDGGLLNNQLYCNSVDEQKQTPINNGFNKISNKAYQTKLFLEKELRGIIQRKRSLFLNYKYIMNKLSCGKLYATDEVKLLNKADELVRQDLDIFMILDRLKELEKLKQVLFSQEQQTIFNFFPKPLISINNNSKNLNARDLAEEAKKETSKSKKAQKKVAGNLKLSLKNIGVLTKAATRFKKNAFQNKISDYQQLYFCYETLIQQSEQEQDTKLNKKLIDFLGSEMQKLFIITRQRSLKEKQEEKTFDLNSSQNFTPKNISSQDKTPISLDKQSRQQLQSQQYSSSKFRMMSQTQQDQPPQFLPSIPKVYSIDHPKNPSTIQGEDILVQFDEDDYENVEDNSQKKIEE